MPDPVPLIELDQATPAAVTLSVAPADLALSPQTRVRAEFRQSLGGPVVGVLSTEKGTITVGGQDVVLTFTYDWLRNLQFTGGGEVVTLHTTLVFDGDSDGSARLDVRVTRSYTLGSVR